ncbi:MAG TPA: ferredoxin-thioredoxin reductase catalytic domain-containing protein [Magnetospirillaceae bacterium]|nr:ferredoxin-thioredoxin reductase catalytic domain-containing protein [Magnetospirillaceae bacterium]
MSATKTLEDTRRFAAMVAAKQKWALNPDIEFRDTLLEGLTVNWNRYGYYLCPCRDSEGSREADFAVLCPCRYAREDVAVHGHCFCALFLRLNFTESGGLIRGIPDRRYSG